MFADARRAVLRYHMSGGTTIATALLNIEEGAETQLARIRRPRCLFFAIACITVVAFTGGPIAAAMGVQTARPVNMVARSHSTSEPPPPPPALRSPSPLPMCGDGKCEPPEDIASCFADCPGVTTSAMCGEEPHSDPGGEAVAWGLTHKTATAAECCERCQQHANNPKNQKKPCNSWVFCPLPQCWSLDARASRLQLGTTLINIGSRAL